MSRKWKDYESDSTLIAILRLSNAIITIGKQQVKVIKRIKGKSILINGLRVKELYKTIIFLRKWQ
jgi:hypothetical protein